MNDAAIVMTVSSQRPGLASLSSDSLASSSSESTDYLEPGPALSGRTVRLSEPQAARAVSLGVTVRASAARSPGPLAAAVRGPGT
jgi:hypothetical protein